MKRSRSNNLPLTRARSTIKRKSQRSSAPSRTSLILRESWLSLRMRRLASLTYAERYSSSKRSTWSNNRKLSSLMTNLRNHLMFIVGGSLSALTQRPMSLFKRSNPCKSVWLPRLRKSVRRMFLSKRKRSSILNSRTSLPNRVAQKLPRNSRSTSRTWRSEPSSWKTWLQSWRTIRRRLTLIVLRMSVWTSRSRT